MGYGITCAVDSPSLVIDLKTVAERFGAYPSQEMAVYPVSQEVNTTQRDTPDCVVPLSRLRQLGHSGGAEAEMPPSVTTTESIGPFRLIPPASQCVRVAPRSHLGDLLFLSLLPVDRIIPVNICKIQ